MAAPGAMRIWHPRPHSQLPVTNTAVLRWCQGRHNATGRLCTQNAMPSVLWAGGANHGGEICVIAQDHKPRDSLASSLPRKD